MHEQCAKCDNISSRQPHFEQACKDMTAEEGCRERIADHKKKWRDSRGHHQCEIP